MRDDNVPGRRDPNPSMRHEDTFKRTQQSLLNSYIPIERQGWAARRWEQAFPSPHFRCTLITIRLSTLILTVTSIKSVTQHAHHL
jgi:hypothetical protein